MINLIKRDLLLVYKTNVYKWLLIAVVVAFLTFVNLFNLNNWLTLYGDSLLNANVVDVLFENFKGKEVSPEIPIIWVTFQLYIVFLAGSYFFDDMQDAGIYIITRSSRRQWWMSKVISMVISIIFYYLMLFLITLLISSLWLDTSFEWSRYAKQEILPLLKNSVSSEVLLLNMFGLLVTSSILFSTIHATLSLIIKPVFGYLVVTIIIFLSVFMDSFFSPSMHSMILRQNIFFGGASKVIESYLYNLIPSVVLTLIGGAYFKRKDL